MNSSVYVYGNLSAGYTQFPSDYSKGIFQIFYQKSSAPSQIIVHRENNLMYYGYIRKLDDSSQYIGFCILLNGLMFTDIAKLFPIFEATVERLISNGEILGFNEWGKVVSHINTLSDKQFEVDLVVYSIQTAISKFEADLSKLPPVNYGISTSERKAFYVEDNDNATIVKAAADYDYTYIYKKRGQDTETLTSYRGVIGKLNKDKSDLEKKNSELSKELSKTKAKQRNIIWVGLLVFVVFVLGIIVWNKVLYPSEVTSYKTDQFIYYGPLNGDRRPNGIGVAIYYSNDKDGRKYYFGNFDNGRRNDTEAVLFYKNGNYFYGSMKNDRWESGVMYNNSDNCYFNGTFDENEEPYDGVWYDFRRAYGLSKGKVTR